MTLGIYDTVTLAAVVRNLKLPATFLQATFYPNTVEFDTETIAIDVDAGKRRIAPFVSPLMQGKPVESRGIATSTFTPPYVKDKRQLDPFRPVMRAIGERIGGSLSAPEREMANIAFELEDQVQMITRRLEVMAGEELATGKATISGEGYPTSLVDFGRDASLTIDLTAAGGASTWSAAHIGTPNSPGTVSPAEDLETWSTSILEKSGAVCDVVVFTKSAWNGFVRDPRVRESIWFPRAGDSLINLGGGIKTGAVYKGNWGFFQLWLYNDWYVDPVTDISTPILTDGTVLVGSSEMQGVRAFGAIIDPGFGYGAMAFAPKSWVEQDPAARMLMMQSAPLLIPARVNACLSARVI